MWIGEEVGMGQISGINSLEKEKEKAKRKSQKKSQKKKKRDVCTDGVVKAEKTPSVGQRRAVGSRQCILNHTVG